MADFCTVANLTPGWLPSNLDSTDTGTILPRLIATVSADIRNVTGRQFDAATYTETQDGRGGTVVFVPERPITSVTSVTVSGRVIPQRTTPTGGGWVVGGDGCSIHLAGYTFCRGIQNVAIIYAANGPFPADLVEAAIRTVAHRFVGKNWIAQNSRTVGQDVTAYDKSAWPQDVVAILGRYALAVAA